MVLHLTRIIFMRKYFFLESNVKRMHFYTSYQKNRIKRVHEYVKNNKNSLIILNANR